MSQEYVTNSFEETRDIGEKIAKKILKSEKNKAFVIGLKGELGGGKTTFLQGLSKGLGIKEKILSPTFVILKRFVVKDKRFKNFYHIDCYRIKDPKELLDLGFKEILSDSTNIIAIEWADQIKKILPKDTLWIEFEFVDKETRKIKCG